MLCGDQRCVRLDSVPSKLLETKSPQLFQVVERNEQRFSSEQSKRGVAGSKRGLDGFQVVRLRCIRSEPLRILVTILARYITEYSKWPDFYAHIEGTLLRKYALLLGATRNTVLTGLYVLWVVVVWVVVMIEMWNVDMNYADAGCIYMSDARAGVCVGDINVRRITVSDVSMAGLCRHEKWFRVTVNNAVRQTVSIPEVTRHVCTTSLVALFKGVVLEIGAGALVAPPVGLAQHRPLFEGF
jgi:hypothetical protein